MSELTRIPAPGCAAATRQNSLPQALDFARAGSTPFILGTGRFGAVAGQLALDERGRPAGEGDPAAQARQAFENLRRRPASAGAGFDDVVKLTHHVTDMTHTPAVRAARAEHIPGDRLPAASAVRVAALVEPEFLMEVGAFAVVAP
ncbi:Rid family hydrolase [Streptomyces sp. NPDC012474]|uniref:RidA family protein n=1 Tax=Streptomyces sp. NPDC012474 TaxID=3364836 RepID=UPI0036E58CCD